MFVNPGRGVYFLKFPTYIDRTHIKSKQQNQKLAQITVLIFTASVFFFGHLQITDAQTIHIPDRSLRSIIELTLGKKAGEDITQADMENLKSLQVSNCHFLTLTKMGVWWRTKRWLCESTNDILKDKVRDITGLEFATNLTHLSLGRNQISDISPLKNLTNLTYLSLGRNQISDISPLKNLTNLTHLFLIHNSISDISALKNLAKLVELDLEGNRLSDVPSLKDLTNLIYLSLRKNEISDISPLKDLTKLTYLSLRENKISDVSSLKDLTNLTYLHIGFNYTITDISALKNLINLIHLQLDHNQISDISALKNLINLKHLDASDNEISDLFPLKDLTKLTWLDLDTIKKLDLSQLKHLTNLTSLDIHDNKLSDLSHLKNLTKLKHLDLDDNEIFDVFPLKGLTYLTKLDLSGNQIADVSPLSELVNLTVLDLSNNHIFDFSPIAGLIENLAEYNNINQTFPTYKPADVNRDGIVNIIDIVLAASNFDAPDLPALAAMNIYPDVNGDGVVDIRDLGAIASEIGSASAPTLSKHSVESVNLTVDHLSDWVELAKRLDPQDPQLRKGVSVLERLLASVVLAEGSLKETALLANYPNPFNPETWIPYQLAEPAVVNISIHSSDGRLVRELALGYVPAGMYHSKSRAAYWDGRNALGESVASGVYFYSLTAGDFTATGKMLIRK